MTMTDDLAPPAEDTPGVQLQVQLTAAVTSLAGELKRANDYQEQLAQNVQYVSNIPLGTITASGVPLDLPTVMGPRTGQCWEVRRMTAATFSGGTVSFYRDAVADSNLVMEFNTPGIVLLGGGQLILQPGERLVAEAGGLAGVATLSIAVIQIGQPWLPAYLL